MTTKNGNASGKAKLSKNLLQMKFMKRTVLRAEEEEQLEQKKIVEDAEHWTVQDLGHRESNVIYEPSYTAFEDLRFGRMSFRGFNPTIEKIMKAQNNVQAEALSDRREKKNAVSDDEMAERYNSLIQTMNKKFTKKKERESRPQEKKRKQPDYNRKRNRKFQKSADRTRFAEEEKAGPSQPKKRRREFKKPSD